METISHQLQHVFYMFAGAGVELRLRVQAVGSFVLRYGLVLVIGWIGLMKFTEYEAKGIEPLVARSPLMSKERASLGTGRPRRTSDKARPSIAETAYHRLAHQLAEAPTPFLWGPSPPKRGIFTWAFGRIERPCRGIATPPCTVGCARKQ